MTDKPNGNLNENIEEEEEMEENIINNQVQEEYEEEGLNQGIEEDGPEFSVAFDIQINNGSFILLVGKTEENKLILRLVEKEDDNKPFYQNEFSLEELTEKNAFFNNFKNENDAIECIIKNLNESEKELEIIDDNTIEISVTLIEDKSKIDFVLLKTTYMIEGEDEQEQEQKQEQEQEQEQSKDIKEQNMNIQNGNENNIEEDMNNLEEEQIEDVENDKKGNYNDNYDNAEHIEEANLEYSEENLEKGDNKERLNNENISTTNNSTNNNNLLSNNSAFKNAPTNLQNENALQTILEETNENIVISPESTLQNIEHKKETSIINESNEQNDTKDQKQNYTQEKDIEIQNVKISKIIEELKDNLDSLGGAINYIDQDEEEELEQNTNENEVNKIKIEDFGLFKNDVLKTVCALSENFNSQLKRQTEYIIKIENNLKEENDKRIKEMKNELNQKDNQLNDIKNIFNDMLNEKISILEESINKTNNELKSIKNREINSLTKKQGNNEQEKDIPEISNDEIKKVKNDLDSKIKEIEQKINDVNKNDNLNVNINTCMEKISDIENKLKQNEPITPNSNSLYNLENKIKTIEIKIKNGVPRKGDKDRKVLLQKISNLENKFNDFEKNSNLEQSKEIFEKMNNLEKLINELKDKKKKTEVYLKKSIEEINNNDIINKVNNLINWTKTYENEFQNMETELKNYDNYLEGLEKRMNKLEKKNLNILRQSNDLKQDKNKNEFFERVVVSKIDTNEESNSIILNRSTNSASSSNVKKAKKNKNYHHKNKDANNREKIEISTKNYRVIKHFDDNSEGSKKYMSNTFNKGVVANSHSANKFNLKKENYIDKNSIEYQILTRPRSKSKDHKRNRPQDNLSNLSDNHSVKSNKHRDINPPIPREYENSITESRIVEYDDITFIENRIKEIYPKFNIDFNLVYRASDDGDKALDFHRKCDKIGPNVTFVKTKKDYVFGGFTVKNWEHLKRDMNDKKPNLGSASRDAKAFGFCVNNQRIYKNERPEEFAIWCNRNFGATFKNNFFQIFDNCFKKGGYCSKKDNSHFGGQEYDYEISGGESKFGIDDIEVYEILFQ